VNVKFYIDIYSPCLIWQRTAVRKLCKIGWLQPEDVSAFFSFMKNCRIIFRVVSIAVI